jgi:hypothetical protein
MRFFFYGTLMDRDVLSRVVGRPVICDALKPASLPGYRRTAIHDASYPIVLRHKAGRVDGVTVDGISTGESARLSIYEGQHYDLVRAFAELPGHGKRAVFLFEPRPGAFRPTDTEWSLAGWQAAHKDAFLDRIGRIDFTPAG